MNLQFRTALYTDILSHLTRTEEIPRSEAEKVVRRIMAELDLILAGDPRHVSFMELPNTFSTDHHYTPTLRLKLDECQQLHWKYQTLILQQDQNEPCSIAYTREQLVHTLVEIRAKEDELRPLIITQA